jgi:hypothetical protein
MSAKSPAVFQVMGDKSAIASCFAYLLIWTSEG